MLFEMGRTLLSLSFVLGLLWVIARVGRGRQSSGRAARMAPGGGGNRIEMLGRRSLGRHSAIVVIRTGGRTMVVGQTPQHITLLAEEEAKPVDVPAEATSAGLEDDLMPRLALGGGADAPKAWDALVDRLREMTVRH